MHPEPENVNKEQIPNSTRPIGRNTLLFAKLLRPAQSIIRCYSLLRVRAVIWPSRSANCLTSPLPNFARILRVSLVNGANRGPLGKNAAVIYTYIYK